MSPPEGVGYANVSGGARGGLGDFPRRRPGVFGWWRSKTLGHLATGTVLVRWEDSGPLQVPMLPTIGRGSGSPHDRT